jgi:hypothetical protein
MKEVVLTFAPGDPVPSWFMAIEPRQDVPGHLPRLGDGLLFAAPGRIVDDGACYVVEVDPGADARRVVVGETRYCHVTVERPVLWANGEYWPGCGVPEPASWTPDPARVKRIADVERSREALMSDRLVIAPGVPDPTYYKAAGLVALGFVFGLLIMGAVVGTVLAVLT